MVMGTPRLGMETPNGHGDHHDDGDHPMEMGTTIMMGTTQWGHLMEIGTIMMMGTTQWGHLMEIGTTMMMGTTQWGWGHPGWNGGTQRAWGPP